MPSPQKTGVLSLILKLLLSLALVILLSGVAWTHPSSPLAPALATDAQASIPQSALLEEAIARHFKAGLSAMLWRADPAAVLADAARIHPYYRPYFLVGAGMGYLPAGQVHGGMSALNYDTSWAALRPGLRALAHLGPGLWHGVISAGRPERLSAVGQHLPDPMLRQQIWVGYGLSLAWSGPAQAWAQVSALEAEPRALATQGLAMCLSLRGDAQGLVRLEGLAERDEAGAYALEVGSSYAAAFAHVHHLSPALALVVQSPSPEVRRARLTGLALALDARQRSDPAYFRSCLRTLTPAQAQLADALASRCAGGTPGATSLRGWQDTVADCATQIWGEGLAP